MKYDIIGDIHGHADHLKKLLYKLGYKDTYGYFSHPERTVIFVGDYIDRGPEIPEVLGIVKAMADNKAAIALMGNHEYNAICFATEKSGGGHLRKHDIKNFRQHSETLLQFQGRQEEYDKYIEWFRKLPLWYEDDHIRVVHACWNERDIAELQRHLGGRYLSDEAIVASHDKAHTLYRLTEELLKGKEIRMPEGTHFMDKDGHKRHHIRIKWWLDQRKTTIKDISVIPMDDRLPGDPVERPSAEYYDETQKPVFFGHYWLQGEPNLYRGNVCCLDYSVAKGGYLTAYRYDGETTLERDKLVFV